LKLDLIDPYRVGVVFGTTVGGMSTITEEQTQLLNGSRRRVTPYLMPKILPNLAASQIAIRHGLKGPSLTISTACATGADVVGTAMSLLKSGIADVILAGASDCLYCQLVFGSLSSARAMSTRNEEPARASRPFDLHRDGFLMGEGSGLVVLETLEHAQRRNCHIWGEVIGYANCGDGFHTTAPRPDGTGQIYCMRRALASAAVSPAEIDYINAHATSTPQGDRVETLAVKEVFGPRAYEIPISSIKGATGHMMAAAGIVELIVSLKSIREGIVPPTINYENRDPECDLNYVPNQAQRVPVKTVLSNSFGFGGQNASIVVRDI
jgi:3-oxoacyl-[acyl-carrier-protein] synthase II